MRKSKLWLPGIVLGIGAALSLGAGVVLADNPTAPAGAPMPVIGVKVTNQGSGYPAGIWTVGFTGSGSGASANVSVNATGSITAVTILNGGSGYTTAPTLNLSGLASGGGATFTVTIGMPAEHRYYWVAETKYLLHNTRLQNCATCHAWRNITSVTVTNQGAGYTAGPPTVTFGSPGTGNLLAAGTVVKTSDNRVASVTMIDQGFGYISGTAGVTIKDAPAGGTTATGTAVISNTWTLNPYGQELLKQLQGGTLNLAEMGNGTIFTQTAYSDSVARDNAINAALIAAETADADADAVGADHGAAPASGYSGYEIWALTMPGNANDKPRDVGSVAGAGMIGDIHGGFGDTPDQCARCHRAHTAKAPALLTQDQYGMCTSCHDGSGANTSVVGGVIGADGLKGGGFVSVVQSTDTISAPAMHNVTSSHVVDEAATGWLGTMWGNGTTGAGRSGVGLECGSCHDPHNPRWNPQSTDKTDGVIYQYRMLKLVAPTEDYGDAFSKIGRLAVPAESGTHNYVQTYAALTGNNAVASGQRPVTTYQPNDRVGQFCAQCHTRYMSGFSTSHANAGLVELIPTGDPTFAYQHATKEATCESFTCHSGTTFTRPRCLDCHVSHGTSAQMGAFSSAVKYPDETDRPAGKASALLRTDNRGVCTMCHSK